MDIYLQDSDVKTGWSLKVCAVSHTYLYGRNNNIEQNLEGILILSLVKLVHNSASLQLCTPRRVVSLGSDSPLPIIPSCPSCLQTFAHLSPLYIMRPSDSPLNFSIPPIFPRLRPTSSFDHISRRFFYRYYVGIDDAGEKQRLLVEKMCLMKSRALMSKEGEVE